MLMRKKFANHEIVQNSNKLLVKCDVFKVKNMQIVYTIK